MRRKLVLSVDQLYRAQPGGIATYVRGLALGLAELKADEFEMVGLAPRAPAAPLVQGLPLHLVNAPLPLAALTRVWSRWPLGVPRDASIVHATSMAGPFGGGASKAVHSAALHDLLWRDEPGATTRAGVRFHEQRLQLLRRRSDVRVFTSSPGLLERLAGEGFDPSRLRAVRLGVDDDATPAASEGRVRDLLASQGVTGPYTLYVGTREPRKNIDRLLLAHRAARAREEELGPLVIVGSSGWGGVATKDAIVLGTVERSVLKGLYRDAAVMAYVPRAEGWGLPPVEALHEGTRVVASTPTPSVSGNGEVVLVDPLDVDSIADGLVRSLSLPSDEASRARRRQSVADLTWRNCARDHVEGWK